MNLNRQQEQLARLHVGQQVDIQRSNGRIHASFITQINHETNSVTVEWQEKNESKGKELDLDTIIRLNPDLFRSIRVSPHHPTTQDQLKDYVNEQTISNGKYHSKQHPQIINDYDNQQKHVQSLSTARSNGVTSRFAPYHPDVSPQRQFNAQHVAIDGNKPKLVDAIERIALNRQKRRIEQDVRRQKLAEIDHSIPAWEFQAMVNDYRQAWPVELLTMSEPQKDLKVCVCVRKRPIFKRELNKKDIDVLSVPSKDLVIVHVPKVKVDLTKYIDNQKFRFDYAFHESCRNELVYHFTGKPLVHALFQGRNPLVFAYGQTGSGKLNIERITKQK
jgi:kinesin family member 2/24